MEIRTASGEDDTASVLAIARTAPWDKAAFLRTQIAGGNVLVACDAGSVVGFIAWNREFFSLPFIWLAIVAPECRERGVGAALFDAVEAQVHGERLFSSTNKSNVGMQRFLERRGYRPAGEVDLDPGDPEAFYELVRKS